VTFSVAGHTAAGIMALAAHYRFNVSASAPSSTLLDATARGLPAVVRASPHYYNTEEEIDSFVQFVRNIRRL